MRLLLLLLSTGLAFPALAQDAEEQTTIVITGKPLAETEADLAACLARKCPPKEDIAASIAHAENQFIAGDYAAARRTLGQSRGRNHRHAATLPVEVAGLDRAYGRMSDHDGRPDASRLAQIDAIDALRAGLDSTDARVLMQRLMIGDEFAKTGRLRAASDVYGQVRRQARKAGQINVAGYAMLRDAVVHAAAATKLPEYRQAAERKIAAIEKTREPELAAFRDAARILHANVAAYNGDSAAINSAIAGMAARPPEKPLLVFAPAVDAARPGAYDAVLNASKTALTQSYGKAEWIDLRFRIAVDGTVQDTEILRDSGNLSGVWTDLVVQAVAGRRYAPLQLAAGSEGPIRIERFSLVHDLMSVTGSRISGRDSRGRITSLDITDESPRS